MDIISAYREAGTYRGAAAISGTTPKTFLPEHTTAVSLLDRLLHHANVVVTAGDSYRMREARAKGGTTLNKT